MPRTSTHAQRRLKKRVALLVVCLSSLLLFGFAGFYGLNKSDSLYGEEMISVWCLALVGGCLGLRTFKRGHRLERMTIAVALAIIVSSIVIITFFNGGSDSPPLPLQPDFIGE